MKLIRSPLALDKLNSIAEFIVLDKPSAVIDWTNDIFDLADNLGSQAEMGRAVLELIGMGYREAVFGNYK